MSSRPLLLALILSSAGCLGSYADDGSGPGIGPGGNESARSLFTRTVQPVMTMRCASCHGTNPSPVDPDFMGNSPSAYYSTIETYESTTACPYGPCLINPADVSILTTKGVHSGGALGWWTADEMTAVRQWLAAEVVERGLNPTEDPCLTDPTLPECSNGGTGRPTTVSQAMARFAACMDYDLWLAGPGNADEVERYTYSISWANTEDGMCHSCHGVASDAGFCPGGACLMTEAWDTFDSHRKSPSILKMVVPVAGSDGKVDLINANRYVQKGYEGGGGSGHPSFELRAECSTALRGYVQATLDKYHVYDVACTPAAMPAMP
jgi:hypothetical protein